MTVAATETLIRREPADLAATVSRDDLSTALRWAVAGMNANVGLPVLTGAYLRVEGGALTVSTFDYEQSGSASIAAAGGKGHALVPSKALTSMLHVMPRGCDVRLIAKPERLTMHAGDDLVMELPTLPIEEWPEPPQRGDHLFTVSGERFAHLARGAVASGRDDSLPVLTCTRLESHDGKIVAASTDRYRLSVAEVTGRFPARLGPFNVPSRVMVRLGKAFAKDTEVNVYLNRDTKGHGGRDDVLTFVSGGRVLHTRLVDGEFPKYRALLDHEVTCHLKVKAAALRTAVRQAAVVVRSAPVVLELGRKTMLDVTGGHYAITTGEPSVKATVREITYDGDAMKIGANPDYLAAGLGAVLGDDVTLALGSPTKPLTIKGDADEGFTYLLMPVRLAE